MASKRTTRALWAAISTTALGAVGVATAAPLPVFIPKPQPFTNASQEAAGSADLAGDFSLMGAKILTNRGEDSGGAYLFENGNTTPRQVFELKYGATIKYRRYYHSHSADRIVAISETECSFTQNMVKGGFLGERVALSSKWAALASYEMGRGFTPPHEVANCDNNPGAVPAIFLAKRNASGSPLPFGPLNYAFNTPFRERVQSMDLSDTDLVVMGAGRVYVFSYDQGADEWKFNTSLLPSHDFGEYFGQTVAIDGNHIVVGDRQLQQIFVFRKQGSTWSQVFQYQSSDNAGFGRAVDISGNNIIVAGEAGADIFEFDSTSLRFLSRGRDSVNPKPVSSVAISGDHAVAVEVGNTQTFAHYARNLAEGGFYSSARIGATGSEFLADNINMDGIRVLSGSNDWSPNSSVFPNVGAMIWEQIQYQFMDPVTVDDAEGERIWHNVGAFNWERHHGSTQSSGTGPQGGADGSPNYYYVETSLGGAYNAGSEAMLESDYAPTAGGLEFDYHMQGANVGKLYIEAWDDGERSWETLDLIDGTQGYNRSNDWRRYYVSLDALPSLARLRFRYVAAGGWQGDVALDNITIAKQ